MPYDANVIIESYDRNAEVEDASEKAASLRVEIPRAFIRRYLRPADVVLDAGGGTGVTAIMMAKRYATVTLLDIAPGVLELARRNIADAGLVDAIGLVQGDITELSMFPDKSFSFVVCVGDALSYALNRRFAALDELVRVAQCGATMIIGCDSKLGFLRMKLAAGDIDEAVRIMETSESTCGMGPRTHLYTVDEMTGLLEMRGCRVVEVASTPSFADTIDLGLYEGDPHKLRKLKQLESELCTRPELLGTGLHLLFVATTP
ncbi:class I SAM-dependent methyltransferase [Candidatus Bipolaricaulota bacterium]|nr:class I SAM-dependent methyltransferase [Candidatus Bipolaricaulota bacterium]